jgi:ABC-type nitrate/sulfonate/bicarbonate transport system ATPase subunit
MEGLMAPDERPVVQIANLTKIFPAGPLGREVVACRDLHLEVRQGEFLSLVGPSGCGKSTVLNIIAEIDKATSGTVTLGERGNKPRIGYVFQRPRLLDWMSVENNLKFVLKASGIPRERWEGLIAHHLDLVGLGGQQRNFPLNLSGGMQQRVGIARALVIEPDLLLMDEPFSNLDEITARKLRVDLTRIQSESRTTTLFVTHDLREAVFLSDTIHLMRPNPGRIFKQLRIDLERPRDYEDERVFALERSLILDLLRAIESDRPNSEIEQASIRSALQASKA